jgi:hypothetical protein
VLVFWLLNIEIYKIMQWCVLKFLD